MTQVMDNGVVRDATAEEEAEIAARASVMPTVDDYRAAIQAMLDTKAKERRYYDIQSACTYSTSTNPTFKAEASVCVAWRDAVWATAYATLDQVNAGAIPQPTIAEMLAMLPTMTWPGVA